MEELVSLVLLAGELLLTCGAEMYRVEETVERMGKAAGFSQVEVFATPTGLFLSLHSKQGQVFTRVRRIRYVDNNLSKISQINALSRAFSKGEISIDDVTKELERLQQKEMDFKWVVNIASGLGAGAFALMYGGTLLDGFTASVVGAIVVIAVSWIGKYPIPRVLQAFTGATVAASLVYFASLIIPLETDVVILGAVMLLAPGVVMTTAIRDMLSGELVSGVSRGAEALAIAVAVATGVAVVLSIGGL
ncbi:MAG: threonine/serine exporter family protein [Firmicutes bacterium]|jgi:uncharacterized membrane protein YjjP (DUF1212 family)|nr:threonine/serine exporter family protein [Bacillota bacterium]